MWLIVAVVVLALAVAAVRSSGRAQLDRFRTEWGQPVDRRYKMDAILESHRSRVAAGGSGGSLDDRTWDDLNLDAVFAAVDRTVSTLGQHALYHRLRTAPGADHLDAFDALVGRMGSDGPARERAQVALAPLQDPNGYDLWWLARPDVLERRSWYVVFPLLAVALLLLAPGAWLWPSLLPALVAALAVNVVLRISADRHIGAVAAVFRQLAPLIAAGQSLQFLEGEDIDAVVRCVRAEVPRLRRLKLISRWVSGNPLMLPIVPSPLTVMISDGVLVLSEYLNFLFPLDANAVYFGLGDLRAHDAAFLHVIAAIGDVDAAVSVASFRAGTGSWSRPRFQAPGQTAVFTDIRHPLVADAVPNTITLEASRGALVTGSNMSGKSTFLRTVGVNAVLAQTINTCLASAYEAPVFNVQSCIGRADDLLTGKSYYIVEVEALLGLVRASADKAPHLFLLDELFRGTNAVERIAAGQALLEELVAGAGGRKPHVVLAATHDGELVELVASHYDPYHFGDTVGPDGLVFDHRLQSGPSTTRNAIVLLRLHGAPEGLVSRAMTCAAALDRQRAVASS